MKLAISGSTCIQEDSSTLGLQGEIQLISFGREMHLNPALRAVLYLYLKVPELVWVNQRMIHDVAHP
jgi:hypothetical protein